MRIVAHTCSNTEIVCALGRGDWLVGVDDHSDFPVDTLAALPRIGADLDVDVERIRELEPDLVITSLTVPGHERCLERIAAAGLPYIVTQPTILADVAADIRRIGQALDAHQTAEALAAEFDRLLGQPPPPGAAVPILVEWWPKPVIVPGGRSWVNEMLHVAGAFNPWAGHDMESIEATTPQVQEAAPQAVIMSWCGVTQDKYRPHIVRRRAGWEEVPAIREDRIFAVSEAWLGRPGPRLLQGVERLREIVATLR